MVTESAEDSITLIVPKEWPIARKKRGGGETSGERSSFHAETIQRNNQKFSIEHSDCLDNVKLIMIISIYTEQL